MAKNPAAPLSTVHITDQHAYVSTPDGQNTLLDSPASWAWAETASSFRVALNSGNPKSYLVRREKRRNAWYWYACLKKDGKIHRVYVGKPGTLSRDGCIKAQKALQQKSEKKLEPKAAIALWRAQALGQVAYENPVKKTAFRPDKRAPKSGRRSRHVYSETPIDRPLLTESPATEYTSAQAAALLKITVRQFNGVRDKLQIKPIRKEKRNIQRDRTQEPVIRTVYYYSASDVDRVTVHVKRLVGRPRKKA